jgi:hypothetical protein
MEQVLRIFRKDVRRLSPGIVAVIAVFIVHAVIDARTPMLYPRGARMDSISTLLNMFLPLAIWFLIAQVIFQEAIPGEQQFWLTRPYHWSKLLASKVLFVVAFISVPLFLSDCYILAMQGLPVRGDFIELLFRQVIVAAVFILPSFAIAAVTAGLAQFLLGWFVLLLAFVSTAVLLSTMYGNHVGISIDRISSFSFVVLAVIACGVVVWQYARRNTLAARLVLLATTCGFLIAPMGLSFGRRFHPPETVQQEPSNRFDVRIAFDPSTRVSAKQEWETPPEGHVRIRIPLTVVGLTDEQELHGSATSTIYADGRTWPGHDGFYGGSLDEKDGRYWQTLFLEKKTFDQFKGRPVNLHISYNLDVLKDELEATIPVTNPSFSVPGVGVCHSNLDVPQFQLTCRAGLTHRPEVDVRLEPSPGPDNVVASFPAYSMPWGLSPITDLHVTPFSVEQTNARLAFVRRLKLGSLRRTLEMENIRLADFVPTLDGK